MCQLCLDSPATVQVYVRNGNPCALDRFIDRDVCDDCEADAVRYLEDVHPDGRGMAYIVRWAA